MDERHFHLFYRTVPEFAYWDREKPQEPQSGNLSFASGIKQGMYRIGRTTTATFVFLDRGVPDSS